MKKIIFFIACLFTLSAFAQEFKLNDKGYFERRGVNILVFSNPFNGGFNDEKTGTSCRK